MKMNFFFLPENSDGRDVDFLEEKNSGFIFVEEELMMKVPEFLCCF